MRPRRVLPWAVATLAVGVAAAAFGAGDGEPLTAVTSRGPSATASASTSTTVRTGKTTTTTLGPTTSVPVRDTSATEDSGQGDLPAPGPGTVTPEVVPPAAAAPPLLTEPAAADGAPAPAPGDPVQVVMRGRLTSPSGQPVAGICVAVHASPMGGPIPEGLTDADGRYEVVYRGPDRGQPTRNWDAAVRECSERVPAYKPAWLRGVFNVPVGGSATIDAVVARPATVGGTVTGPGGRPLERYCLWFRDGFDLRMIRTAADGTYVIPAANASSDIHGGPGCLDDGPTAGFDVLFRTPPDGGQITHDITVAAPAGDDPVHPVDPPRRWTAQTMTADRGPEEPVPSCAPNAGGGVWAARRGLMNLNVSGYGAFAVYHRDESGALVERGCWTIANSTYERYTVAGAPNNDDVLVQFAGTQPDSFASFEL